MLLKEWQIVICHSFIKSIKSIKSIMEPPSCLATEDHAATAIELERRDTASIGLTRLV